jgi:hypothetical protein
MFAICVSMCSLSLSLSVLFVAADRCYSGVDLHSHTHSFSLSLSATLPFVLPFKKVLRHLCGYHWNTRFDCIRLFSFHKGSTNTKLVKLEVYQKSVVQQFHFCKNICVSGFTCLGYLGKHSTNPIYTYQGTQGHSVHIEKDWVWKNTGMTLLHNGFTRFSWYL